MSAKMVNASIIAENWGISTRRINQLCNANAIEGAKKEGGLWKIPIDAPKPENLRTKKKMHRSQTTELLPCPVGITSYKEVSSECYYVDKTLLIKDIIDDHNKVTLFTRPRRFGKTLAMDMLKTYFEKVEDDTSVYFSNRDIWSCSDVYKNYQGAYPVIFLSFKDAHQSTWDNMYESLSLSIRNEFKRHISILQSDKATDIDKDFYRRVVNNDVSNVECQASLGMLSHILAETVGSRVVVIIDEYDTPIQQGYSNGYYDEVIAFMRNLFSSVFKDNEDLEFGILTGILRVAKESLFSGLNNLVVNTILDEKYSNYFGFTEYDVRRMAEYYGKTEKLAEIATWYDGYLFGKTEIYNPWSVICYFNNNCVPKSFWSRTSSNDMILDIISTEGKETRDFLIKLMQGKAIESVVDTDIIYPEVKSSEDTIYSFLLMTGYLKVDEIVDMLDDNPVCKLLLPNREIKAVFKKEILDQISSGLDHSVIRSFQLALKANDEKSLQTMLRQYLYQAASVYDTAKENFYHGMMLGLLAIMSDDYLITSNREAGDGRFDIQLKPFSSMLPGILMEFKASDSIDEDKLSELANDAIRQIKEKKYAEDLKANGISEIQIYGIAFSKKKATVRTEQL